MTFNDGEEPVVVDATSTLSNEILVNNNNEGNEPEVVCKKGWIQFENSCLKHIKEKRTWPAARKHCTSLEVRIIIQF